MDLGLKDAKALVFGSSSGLGKEVARVLVEEGVGPIHRSDDGDELRQLLQRTPELIQWQLTFAPKIYGLSRARVGRRMLWCSGGARTV